MLVRLTPAQSQALVAAALWALRSEEFRSRAGLAGLDCVLEAKRAIEMQQPWWKRIKPHCLVET